MATEDRSKEIELHRRRLAILREQAALYGIRCDPSITMEIHDIESKLAELYAQGLADSEEGPKRNNSLENQLSSFVKQPKSQTINLNNSNNSGTINNIGSVDTFIIQGGNVVHESQSLAECSIALSEQRYAIARRICEDILGVHPSSWQASAYQALAILQGRSPNAIHPQELKQIEALLRDARMYNWLLPDIILAIIELEYYDIHGIISRNNISVDLVSKRIGNEQLLDMERAWIAQIKMRLATRKHLGL